MAERIPGDKILEFFHDGFRHTAWRLETRRSYAADQRSEAYQRFLRGEPRQAAPDNPWSAMVREQTGKGKRIERVRLLDDPLTQNQQYSLTSVSENLEAGEDVRYLRRADAAEQHLPDEDFWLFDAQRAARFHWDESGWATHLELVDDPAVVLTYCQARDAAWHYAIRYEELTAQVPSAV
ncbi:DUF6879 family protein [Streptacidiphilus albus]|uniref:DUF6879 family protein n=1 Tax=Streptacidiphilus albus TaxID=105425 RepID=UPI0009DDF746